MNTIKLLAIMITLVMVSTCLNQPTRTSSSHASSNPSHSSPTASPRGVIDVYPPRILDFNYTPTKVVWDKVYDVRVSFKVVDDESIERVVLKFIPVEYKYFITKYGMKPEDYSKVFPPEKERVYELKPVDGVFDELKEEFSVEIKNITGGREYKIIITAEDDAGNTQKFEYKTPYIRQYENFGRQLYEKGIIVGASYMSSYQGFVFNKSLDDYPLLGRYIMPPVGDIDEIVLAKHVDWAGYAGINVFFVDAGAWEKWKIDGSEGKVMKNLMDKGIKCAFMWGAWLSDERYFVKGTAKNAPDWSVDLSYPKNRGSFLKQLTQILNSSLVNHSNYLKIDGGPVIFIYDAAVFVNESDAWDILKKNTGKNPYILADIIHGVDDPWTVDRNYYTIWKDLDKYDAISSWVGFIGNDAKNPKYIKNPNLWFCLMNEKWSKFAAEKKLQYVASISPGFKYYYENTGIPRNVEQFKKRVENSLKYTKFIRIDTWNDFDENTFTEPSQDEGFAYLNVLKQVLEEYLENITSPEPQVLDFNWTPTKVAWDKVYDLKVSFKVSYPPDEISGVKLIFKPENYSYFITEYGMRRGDYYKVFPNDSRVYELKPVDGTFDENEEEFKVEVKNITGGAEYWIIIQIQTKHGRTVEYKRKTPYIRQYENNAKKDNLTIMALYLLWWGKNNNWDEYAGSDFSLLGQYSPMDMIVINKHVDWATGYGIDVFLINWPGPGDYQDHALKEYFLKSDLVTKGDIKFAILYETIWRLVDSHPGWNLSDERNIEILTSDFEYLSKNYFQHPAYFRVNGRPFVFVYESKGFFGDINQITILKETFDIYLVSDHGHPEADPKTTFRDAIWGNVAKRFDAIMDRWGYEHYSEADMKRWYGWCNINGIDFIPSATVGLSYKNAPWKFDVPEVPRKTELLKERIQLALKYVDPDIKILFIPEFNNFFENSYLEPSTQDGFKYLTTLKSSIFH